MATITKNMVNPAFNPIVDLQLPWYSTGEDKRYSRIVIVMLFLTLIIGIIIANLPKREIDRKELQKPPAAVAKLMLEEKKKAAEKLPLPKPTPLATNKVVTETKPTPVATLTPTPAPVSKNVIAKSPAPAAQHSSAPVTRDQQVAAAREVAKSSGVLAMQDQLAAMRNMKSAFSGLGGGGGGKGSGIKTLSSTGSKGAGVNRNVLVGSGTGGSGGIQVASAPASGGMGIGVGGGSGGGSGSGSGGGSGSGSGRGDTNVDSVSLGGKIADVGGAVEKQVKSAGAAGNRSEESIRAALDSNKAALYAIYNRALREDPTLQGKVTFKIVIEPDGSVSSCSIVSSDISDTGLTSKLVSRMKMINFGADDVTQTSTQWAIDFLPN